MRRECVECGLFGKEGEPGHGDQKTGEAAAIGPVLMGTRRPVHDVQYGFSVDDVVSLATVGAVEAAS